MQDHLHSQPLEGKKELNWQDRPFLIKKYLSLSTEHRKKAFATIQ